MGMKKPDVQVGKAEIIPGSLVGQIADIQNTKVEVSKVVGRNFQAEAEGKTRCALMEASINGLGPVLGMVIDWKKETAAKEFVDKCRAVAEEAFKYVFEVK